MSRGTPESRADPAARFSRPAGRRILLACALLVGFAVLAAVAALLYRAWGEHELESSVAELEAALGVKVDRSPEPEPVAEDLLPTLKQSRDVHEAARNDVADGDFDAALGRGGEIRALRREMLEDPYSLHQLVARALDAELLDLAHAMVEEPRVGPRHLEALRDLVPAEEDEIRWPESIAREASLAFRDYAPEGFDLRFQLTEPWQRASLVRLWLGFAQASARPVDDVQKHVHAVTGEMPAFVEPGARILIPNIAVGAYRHRGNLLARSLARRAVDLRLDLLAGKTPKLDEPVADLLSGGEVVLERTDDGWILDAVGARAFVREKIPEPASPDAITVHDLPFVWEFRSQEGSSQ